MTHPTPEERAKERAKQIVDYAFGVYAGKPASERGDDRSFWQVAEDEIAQSLRETAEQARREENEAIAQLMEPHQPNCQRWECGNCVRASAIRSRIAQKDGGT